jgi:hypothetical protein
MPDLLTPEPAAENETVVEGEDGRVLGRIAEDPVVLAVWRRRPTAETRALSRWLDVLPPERLPEVRFVATPDEIPRRLGLLCDMVELVDCPMRVLLIADITQLGSTFARLAGVDRIDVKHTVGAAAGGGRRPSRPEAVSRFRGRAAPVR